MYPKYYNTQNNCHCRNTKAYVTIATHHTYNIQIIINYYIYYIYERTMHDPLGYGCLQLQKIQNSMNLVNCMC